MMKTGALVAMTWGLGLALGCSGGAGGAGGESADPCADGCAATMAAACANGPASQAVCERDCRALLAGDCGAEYQALQRCAVGEAVTCDAAGLPSVTACADEQGAFVACLN